MLHVKFKKTSCYPDNFKKKALQYVDFKKVPCRMSLMPKKCHVAVSFLRVHTPIAILYSIIEHPIAGWWFSKLKLCLVSDRTNVNDIQPISTEKEYEVGYQHKGQA